MFLTLRLKSILIGAACLLCFSLDGQDLSAYKWENRIIIISSSENISDQYLQQLKLFSQEIEALKERKLILCQHVGDHYKIVHHPEFVIDASWRETSSLNKYLKDGEGFSVVLIGLDGGVKLRQNEILETKDLFSIIDGMPMRKDEIRQREIRKRELRKRELRKKELRKKNG